MSKLSCLVLLLTVLCTLAAAAPKNEIKDNVVLQHEKPGNGELKESKLSELIENRNCLHFVEGAGLVCLLLNDLNVPH